MKPTQEKGIFAANQDFRKYEQVKKNQMYLLAEHENLEECDEEYIVSANR